MKWIRIVAFGLMVVFIASHLVACEPQVPVVVTGVIWPEPNVNTKCVAGITAGGAGVFATVGATGIIAVFGWSLLAYDGYFTAADCLWDANVPKGQFGVWFTCAYGATQQLRTFNTYNEVLNFILYTHCAVE